MIWPCSQHKLPHSPLVCVILVEFTALWCHECASQSAFMPDQWVASRMPIFTVAGCRVLSDHWSHILVHESSQAPLSAPTLLMQTSDQRSSTALGRPSWEWLRINSVPVGLLRKFQAHKQRGRGGHSVHGLAAQTRRAENICVREKVQEKYLVKGLAVRGNFLVKCGGFFPLKSMICGKKMGSAGKKAAREKKTAPICGKIAMRRTLPHKMAVLPGVGRLSLNRDGL